MRKSTIFISAALTTFALAILYSVVYAYRNATVTAPTPQPAATTIPTDVASPTADTPTVLTPQQAAQLAAQVTGQNDLLSAESANVSGVNAYKISFQSGNVVFVGLDGQILSIQMAPAKPQVIVMPAPTQAAKHKSNNNNSNNSSSEHEGGD